MKRVLLIDDEEIANYLNQLIVKKLGLFEQIDVCDSATKGLELLNNLAATGEPGPDLILLDLNMPVMNGFGFLDVFANMDPAFTNDIKVVILTSSLNEKDRLRAVGYPSVADFCSKPLSTDTVKNLVEKYSMSH